MSGATYDPFSHRYDGLYFLAWDSYNRAIYHWLSGIKVYNKTKHNDVNVLFNTPERAHARLIAPQTNQRVTIPALSFYINSVSQDLNRQFFPTVHPWTTIPTYDSDGNVVSWQRHSKALPYDLSYTVTLWYKYDFEMQQVEANLLWRFTPLSYIMGNGAVSPIYLESISDSSDLEVGPETDRVMRRTYSLRVDAWLPLPYQEFDPLSNINIGMVGASVFSDDIGANNITGDSEIDNINSQLFDNLDENVDIRDISLITIAEAVPGVITYETPVLGGDVLI